MPRLASVVHLDAIDIEIGSPGFERAGFLFAHDGHPDVSSVFVCVDDDSLGVSAALTLHRHLQGSGVPVVVRMVHDAGLATLLGGEGSDGGFASLHAFGLLDRTCSADLLLSGMTETLARAMHEEYRRSRTGEAADPATNPSMAPWEDLPETLRESNRDQAGHIGDTFSQTIPPKGGLIPAPRRDTLCPNDQQFAPRHSRCAVRQTNRRQPRARGLSSPCRQRQR